MKIAAGIWECIARGNPVNIDSAVSVKVSCGNLLKELKHKKITYIAKEYFQPHKLGVKRTHGEPGSGYG